MKKAILVFLALLLIGGGLYGTNYFLKLNTAETMINQSIHDLEEGKYDNAESKLKQIISQFNSELILAPAYYLLGQVYTEQGLYSQALNMYNEIITNRIFVNQKLWKYQALISISRLYRRKMIETSEQMISDFKEYIVELLEEREEKSNKTLSIGQGNFYEKIYSFFQAILSFTFRPNLNIPSEEILLQTLKTELGYMYLENHEYQAARKMFLLVDNQLARLGLARIYLETGEKDKGLLILEELKDYDSSGKIKALYVKEAFFYAENLYRSKKYTQAEEIFKKVFETVPNSDLADQALYYIALYHYDQKDYVSALKYIDHIMLNSSGLRNEDAQLLKGYINYHTRDFKSALRAFNQFINMFPYSRNIKKAYEWKMLCERAIKYLN